MKLVKKFKVFLAQKARQHFPQPQPLFGLKEAERIAAQVGADIPQAGTIMRLTAAATGAKFVVNDEVSAEIAVQTAIVANNIKQIDETTKRIEAETIRLKEEIENVQARGAQDIASAQKTAAQAQGRIIKVQKIANMF